MNMLQYEVRARFYSVLRDCYRLVFVSLIEHQGRVVNFDGMVKRVVPFVVRTVDVLPGREDENRVIPILVQQPLDISLIQNPCSE